MVRRVLLVLVAASLLLPIVDAKADLPAQVHEKSPKMDRESAAKHGPESPVGRSENAAREPTVAKSVSRAEAPKQVLPDDGSKPSGETAEPREEARAHESEEQPEILRSNGPTVHATANEQAANAGGPAPTESPSNERPQHAPANSAEPEANATNPAPTETPSNETPEEPSANATDPDPEANATSQAPAETPSDGTPADQESPSRAPNAARRGGAGQHQPVETQAQPDPVEAHRGWIGGLLNATQDPREREAEAQSVAPPLFGAQWMLLIFGIGMGASLSAIGVRNMTRRSIPSQPAKAVTTPARRNGLDALVQRVARAPMDSVACFQLAIELLELGIEQDGLRLLDRSIRIDPLLIVQLLQDPQYAPICQSHGVKRLLADVKRNYDRRLLTAYA